MGKATGFIEYQRRDAAKRPVEERLRDYAEIEQPLPDRDLQTQAARCMDCGIPFCHGYGCPLANLIPEWNDMLYRGQWQYALELLHETNNLPEITGRICPAPCEPACTLSINREPVAIRQIELQLVERGWQEGWIKPRPPKVPTGHRVAVVGSGPAGLAAAQQLARAGHAVTVFEKADRIGGILRYGIPDFKLEKWVIDRRLQQMRQEGVVFETSVEIGRDISIGYLRRSHAAVLLAGGAMVPRDLKVPGRELAGIHFAMDFLTQQNRRNAGDDLPEDQAISAQDRHVVVIGGGDTGSDCVGTALRQGARSVRQIEILPRPPETPDPGTPWPMWPIKLRTSSSHQEGCTREWVLTTKEAIGDDQGRVRALRLCEVEWRKEPKTGRMQPIEKEGAERQVEADLVLLAMGFVRAGNAGILAAFEVATDPDGAPRLDTDYMSETPGVFVAGDLALGASLVVRAIDQGRQAAAGIDRHLQ